jgi:lipid-A-disaccharide synthase
MKLMIVSGEISGDTHGGAILQHLNKLIPGLEVIGIGGPKMEAEGLNSVIPLDDLQARGLVEVLRQLPGHFKFLRRMARMLDEERPDAVLLIDYPGFNLKMAKAAKQRGLPVLYYSGPQLWAWRGGRMRAVQRWVDKIIVIFPFEEPLYKKAGVDAVFLGHPLVEDKAAPEEVAHLKARLELDPGLPVVGIIPGSRPTELERNLPTVLEGLRLIEQAGFRANYVLPLASTLDESRVKALIAQSGLKVQALQNAFLPLLKIAQLAIVASGTATMQVGMAGIPFIVVYRVSYVTYRIAKWFLYVKDIAIVNILAGRRIVPELLQKKFTPEALRDEFLALANDEQRLTEMRRALAEITLNLGEPGAYRRAAEVIAAHLNSDPTAPHKSAARS